MLKSPIKFSLDLKVKIVNQKRDIYLYKKRSRTEQLKENYPSDSNFCETVFIGKTKRS